MKHDFHQRRQNRLQYALNKVEEYRNESQKLYARAQKMASIIPFAQPIHIGHHSEKKDRRYRAKIDGTFRRSFDCEKLAKEWEEQAKIIASNDMISSDDPDAIAKLKDKLETLRNHQDFMKKANKLIAKNDRESFLALPNTSPALWISLTKSTSIWEKGYPHFKLTNNRAKMKATENRIIQLERLQQMGDREVSIKDVKVVLNQEVNRVQIFFPDRVSHDDYKLIRKAGFIWCPSQRAFQAKASQHAFSKALELVKQLTATSA